MTEHVIINGGSRIYPASRSQIVAAVQDFQPEGVEIGLPLDLGSIDLSEYGVFKVYPTSAPATASDEVAERDGVVRVGDKWWWNWRVERHVPSAPESVSMRQARLALLAEGLLDDVEAAVSVADRGTQIEWEYAKDVRRDSPLIASLGSALGLGSEQIDALFIEASKL
jgi:hypothetical protein